MAETAVRGKPVGGRGFRVILAVLVGCFVLAAAVGVGAFDDDEGGTHEPGTDALRAGGILEGTECGPGRICPTEPMLRWVMAVWLVRAVDGADPTGSASGRFSDVSPNEWWATHVERLAELEVTLGCGDGTGFCPADAVTRAQMATFLVRAFGLDADGGSGFGDIAGNTHEASINILAAERVTAGCSTSPLRYCPNRSVTRGQMATFLARALNLVPLPDPPETTTIPPTGQRIAYTVTTDGGNEELRISDPDGSNTTIIDAALVGWSPDGTHIAYVVRTDDGDQLWVVDADGTNPTRITDGVSGGLEWSPDGTHIAYETDEGRQLWMAGADGSKPTELIDSTLVDDWRWSPDSTRIAYTSDGLWVVDADGTNQSKVTDSIPDPERRSDSYDWSPDSTRIAYLVFGNDGDQLWVVDADGTNATKLTDETAEWAWSPDGTRITYIVARYHPFYLAGQLWVAGADGANPTKLTDESAGWAWSPDGTSIAYTARTDSGTQFTDRGTQLCRTDSGTQLWAVDVDGANPTKLTDGDAKSLGWSPDSTHIAYQVCTEDGDRQLWVAGVDGANPTKLTETFNWNPWEHLVWWSPDSTRIAYTSDGLWVVGADGFGQTKLAETLAPDRLAWSPDGGHIAYNVHYFDCPPCYLWVVGADGTNPPKQLTDNLRGVNWGWSDSTRQWSWREPPPPFFG